MIALETNGKADKVEMHGDLWLDHFGKAYRNLIHHVENISDIPNLTKTWETVKRYVKQCKSCYSPHLINTLLRHYSFKNYITLTLRWIHGNDSKHHDKCVMMEPWEEENNWPYLYSYRILLLEDILRSALRDYIFIISFARL